MNENVTRWVDQLEPYLRDRDASGRLHADLHDLLEICGRFVNMMSADPGKPMSRDDLEAFLIELDVSFVDHGLFHLKSLKAEIESVLEKLAEHSREDKGVRGVA